MEVRPISYKTILCLVLLLVFDLGLAAAYLSDRESASNTGTFGYNECRIEEDFDPPEKLTEDVIYKKAVRVRNTGNTESFVRVRVDFSDGNIKDLTKVAPEKAPEDGTWAALGAWQEYLPSDWVLKPDGYYYYTKALSPGAATSHLWKYMRTVFPEGTSPRPYDVFVYAESVQTLDRQGHSFTGEEPWYSAWQEFLGREQAGESGA